MNHRSSAHRAGFQRDVEIAVNQPVIANSLRCCAHRDDFRVRGWIDIAQHAVLPARNNGAVDHRHSANGNFAGFGGSARFSKSGSHQAFIGFSHGVVDAAAFGCCCVMQCRVPSPQIRSPQ